MVTSTQHRIGMTYPASSRIRIRINTDEQRPNTTPLWERFSTATGCRAEVADTIRSHRAGHEPMRTRIQAKIVGRVQGVGFRPTVYRYATERGLAGFVRNDPTGVVLEVEGEDTAVAAFFEQLQQAPPRQAVITGIEKCALKTKGGRQFEVIESESAGEAGVHISPDLATCDDCLRELNDPQDRRYQYPFINCTNCGPRFTIIGDLPYDRANTSMAGFAMCPPCAHEYGDPMDRRFHAQPDACAVCGPTLRIGSGTPSRSADRDQTGGTGSRSATPLVEAVHLLQDGHILAIKSLGGFHLACDAFNADAISKLRARKHRPHKPLAVMFRDVETVKRYCAVGEAEEAELLSVARPIVVLKVGQASRLSIGGRKDKRDACPTVSPDSPTIGAFLPYTPLHHLLLEHFESLVMTSGNMAEEPIASEDAELPAVADAVLTHDRPIVHKCDDSVVRVVNGQRQFLRRARGIVPNAIRFAGESPHLLAVGGELKNTFCLARDGWAFLSQHIGDLKELKTVEYFEREIAEWQRLMRVAPVAIAYDLHPDYLSTKWANGGGGLGQPALPARLIGVQHHHAHIASVMAEHDLHEPVLGIALDGTGYGPDGTVWGGEFLVATRADFERVAHFKQYHLPGGDRAVAEPWRMAASVLHSEGLGGLGSREQQIQKMITAGFNAPLTSSAGRLFDAVAALLGLCDTASYEAQAAIRLEAAADVRVRDCYAFDVRMNHRPWHVDFGRTVRLLVQDRDHAEDLGMIAAKFHNTVAAAILMVCQLVRGERNLETVALSGGVFQNELLLRRTMEILQGHGFTVFTNVTVPPNDGGLALGQVAVAAARLTGRAGWPQPAAGENDIGAVRPPRPTGEKDQSCV
jgi:hydrogenase maturation protein HypF